MIIKKHTDTEFRAVPSQHNPFEPHARMLWEPLRMSCGHDARFPNNDVSVKYPPFLLSMISMSAFRGRSFSNV